MKNIIMLLVCFCTFQLSSQETQNNAPVEVEQNESAKDSLINLNDKVKRFSVGIQAGVPTIAAISAEFVTPLLGNRVAPFINYSLFSASLVGGYFDTNRRVEPSIRFYEFGSNFYFNENGKGLYASLGFSLSSLDFKYTGISFEANGNKGNGNGTASTNIYSTNLKMGYKSSGKVYYRVELGYGFFGSKPENLEISGSFTYKDQNGNDQTQNATKTEKFNVSVNLGNGIFIGSLLGIGVSF